MDNITSRHGEITTQNGAKPVKNKDPDYPMTPETASALAVRAVCTDIESWALCATTPSGCVSLDELLQALAVLRNTTAMTDI
jgi:hypothetical protein